MQRYSAAGDHLVLRGDGVGGARIRTEHVLCTVSTYSVGRFCSASGEVGVLQQKCFLKSDFFDRLCYGVYSTEARSI